MFTKYNLAKAFILINLIQNIQLAEIQLIEQNFVNSSSSIEDWICPSFSNCQKTTCGTDSMFGGINIFHSNTLITKTFDMLPPHYKISISLKFWRDQSWELKDIFTIYVDSVLAHQYQQSGSNNQKDCGTYSIIDINLEVDHFSTSSIIIMTGQFDQSSSSQWWGISEFKLSVIKCPNLCSSCDQYQCFNQVLILESFIQRDFTIQEQEGWQHDDIQIIELREWCGFKSLISPGDYLKKKFDLRNHFAISLYLKVAIFFVSQSKVDVEIDGGLVQAICTNYRKMFFFFLLFILQNYKIQIVSTSELSRQVLSKQPSCSEYQILHQINIYQLEHYNSVLTIKVSANIQNNNNYNHQSQFGIRDFKLFIKPDRFRDLLRFKHQSI